MSKWFPQRNGGIELNETLFAYDGAPVVFIATSETEFLLVVATTLREGTCDSYAIFPLTKDEFDTLKGTCWCFNHASKASLARNKTIELITTDHAEIYHSRFMDEGETRDIAIGDTID